jgi:hypothetical protein
MVSVKVFVSPALEDRSRPRVDIGAIRKPQAPTFGLLAGDLQPLTSPDPLHPPVTDRQTRLTQQGFDFAIAVAAILPGLDWVIRSGHVGHSSDSDHWAEISDGSDRALRSHANAYMLPGSRDGAFTGLMRGFSMRVGPIVLAGLLLSAGADFAASPMSPSDIQATFFNGQPFAATALTGAKFKMTFTPDGKMTREPLAQPGKKNTGTWKPNAKGFCSSWEHARSNCFTVVPIGENKWSVQKIATTISVSVCGMIQIAM